MFYTYKTLQSDLKNVSEAQAFKLRKIYWLATCNGKLNKVGFKRYEQAKRIYNAVRREWRYVDLELKYDSEYNERRANYYNRKACEQITKIKALCKPLKLFCICSTWAHIYATENGNGEIM